MRIDCRDPDYRWNANHHLAVIDADTGFMIEEVVAVDDEEGWIVVNVCDHRGRVMINPETDDIATVKIHRPVKVVDIRNIPNDQRRGVINLTQMYRS